MRLVDCLNAVHDNVWALVVMGGGIALACCKQPEIGTTLITLGAAIFQRAARPSEVKP